MLKHYITAPLFYKQLKPPFLEWIVLEKPEDSGAWEPSSPTVSPPRSFFAFPLMDLVFGKISSIKKAYLCKNNFVSPFLRQRFI